MFRKPTSGNHGVSWVAIILAILTLLPRAASAAPVSIAMAAPDDVGREGRWETLRVTVSVPTGLSTVSLGLQDARGGPAVTRLVGTGDHEVLVPLPLLEVDQLPPGSWPVRLTLSTGAAANQGIVVSVPRKGGPHEAGARLALREGMQEPGPTLLKAMGFDGSVGFMRVSEPELSGELGAASDPPLVFASCDAVLLDTETEQAVRPERAAALIACGVRLIFVGSSPPGGMLGDWVWVHPDDSGEEGLRVWISPREFALRSPLKGIEGFGLSSTDRPRVPATLARVALLVAPISMALLGIVAAVRLRLARGILLLGILLAACTVCGILLMQVSVEQSTRTFSWTMRQAPGSVITREFFHGYGTVFDQQLPISSEEPVALLPVVSTPAEWFNLAVELQLTGTQSFGLVNVPGRQMRWFRSLNVSRAQPLPPLAADRQDWLTEVSSAGAVPPAGVWVENDKVTTVGANGSTEPFSNWVAAQPVEVQKALTCWYAMHVQPAHLYYAVAGETVGGDALAVIDCGQVPPG